MDALVASPTNGPSQSGGEGDTGEGEGDEGVGGGAGNGGVGVRPGRPKRGPGVDLQLVCKATEMLAKAILVEELRVG